MKASKVCNRKVGCERAVSWFNCCLHRCVRPRGHDGICRCDVHEIEVQKKREKREEEAYNKRVDEEMKRILKEWSDEADKFRRAPLTVSNGWRKR